MHRATLVLIQFVHLRRTWQDGLTVDQRWKYTNVLVSVNYRIVISPSSVLSSVVCFAEASARVAPHRPSPVRIQIPPKCVLCRTLVLHLRSAMLQKYHHRRRLVLLGELPCGRNPPVPQVVFYQSGVGTFGDKYIEALDGGCSAFISV